MNKPHDIYSFITQEEAAMSLSISTYGWDWNFRDHVKTSFFYKYGRLLTGNQDNKPVKNIIRPILNLAYRAEDIDVKDVDIYADGANKTHLSFLIKKYHDDVFVIEHDLDTYFDDLKESKIDYGGGLSKKVNQPIPEAVPLQSIAFCDQTDILAGPIGIKHYYSPDQLKDMSQFGWGDRSKGATATLDEVITLSLSSKQQDKQEDKPSQTPGKNIEVYEVHGVLPEEWLTDKSAGETNYIRQLQIVCFYYSQNNEKKGITLFKGKEKENPFKFVNRDVIFGRCLGFGGIEELFEPQVWTTYSLKQKKDFLDSASKTLFKTTDHSLAARNKLNDMENLEIVDVEDGKDVSQIDTFPRNFQLFNQSINEWEQYSKEVGSATGALLGEMPRGSTPAYNSIALVTSQGQAIHNYRQGKFAKHLEEQYRDWIIPEIAKKITNGISFLSTLSSDELQYVSDCLVHSVMKKTQDELVLSGELPMDDAAKAQLENHVRAELSKRGSKYMLEILKEDMKYITLKVKVNIKNKQKDLPNIVANLNRVFSMIFSTYNPQTGTFAIFNDSRMMKILNKIIEYLGLEPSDFMENYKPQSPQTPVSQPIPPVPRGMQVGSPVGVPTPISASPTQ